MANIKSAGENTTHNNDNEDDLHYQALVWNPILAVVDSMVVKCAVKLRLFDSIHRPDNHPISLPELAASLLISPDRLSVLRRLLRYLAHLRLVDLHPDDSVTLTAASSIYLREGSTKSHAAYVKFFIEEDMLAPMHMIYASLGGGEEAGGAVAVEKSRGENLFEWMGRDPAVNSRFNAGMLCTVRPIIEAVLKGRPEVFEGVEVLVDVGGGTGFAAAAIAAAFSSIRCVVYDLACVIEGAPKREGVEYEVGDMHVSVPHADALMFVRVLHLCDDEKALQILSRCKEAIFDEQKGKLIIIDDIISEADAKELLHVKLAYDMMLLQYIGGKERTEKEWRSLLYKAGFTRCIITHVMAVQHVIEARP